MSSLFSLCWIAATTAFILGCSDFEDTYNCEWWSEQGYCSGAGYDDYMRDNCEKTCGYCSGTGGGGDDGDSDGSDGGDWDGQCGKPKHSPFAASFIVGGKEATPHSLPWQLSMQTSWGQHFCGASIINKNWAVTAAHCVNEGDNIKVVAGAHSKSSGGQKYQVERIIKHKEYNSRRMYNDIAMLKIGGAGMTLSDNAMPVCLPSKGYEWATGKELIVSGWGTLRSGGSSPDKLNQVTVPVVDFNTCAHQNSMSTSWKHVVCAGLEQGGKDSCQGDSGGPLVGEVDGAFVLAGVVSWGYGCAAAGLPGVYTHVSHYIDWMNGIMGQ